jgi:hypothetical protein
MANFRPKDFDRLDLRSGERIIFEGKPQKSFILKTLFPFFYAIFGLSVMAVVLSISGFPLLEFGRSITSEEMTSNFGWVVLLPVGIPLTIWFFRQLAEGLRWFNEYYVVTTERVITSTGVFRKRFKEVFYNEVGDVTLEVSNIFDKPFNVGNINFDRERLTLMDLDLGVATSLHKKLYEIVLNNEVNQGRPPAQDPNYKYGYKPVHIRRSTWKR